MDDLVFYEVAMEKREEDAYLETGNQKQIILLIQFSCNALPFQNLQHLSWSDD